MQHDLLSLTPTLISLDGVPLELRAMYRQESDGVYVLSDVARRSMQKIAAGIESLARERDAEHAKAQSERAKAQSAQISAVIMGAVLGAGASGPLAAGACAQYEAEHVCAMRGGLPVVITDAGQVDLKEAVADWMASDAGSIFLSKEKREDYFWRHLVRRTK